MGDDSLQNIDLSFNQRNIPISKEHHRKLDDIEMGSFHYGQKQSSSGRHSFEIKEINWVYGEACCGKEHLYMFSIRDKESGDEWEVSNSLPKKYSTDSYSIITF